MADFFISYTSADRTWAEWIGYVLEEEGFTTSIQAWDFRPGSNFILEMQKAASEAERTILVLSPDYLKSEFTPSEWAAAMAHDPQGKQRKLIPIVVRRCDAPGLLTAIVHINLVDQDEASARKLVIDGVKTTRAKPAQRPTFPGTAAMAHKSFPGVEPSNPARSSQPYLPNLKGPPTDVGKRRFCRQAFDVIQSYFQEALGKLSQHHQSAECDFQASTATDFTAEIFLNGKSKARCRIWLGGMFSSDGISYGEGHLPSGSNACNEILSVTDDKGELYLSSLMGGSSQIDKLFDLKRMSQEQAAEYLWRRFVAWLER